MKSPILYYAAAACLVGAMVNTVPGWRSLVRALEPGAAAMVPIAAAAIGLAGGIWWALTRRTGSSPRLALLCAAVLIAALGLVLTDPRFPAKRIHVPEYIAVAWLVRAGLRHYLNGWSLTVGAALIASLYGVHDELIQGLHPERTYGLVDMASNACGATAGAILTHAFGVPAGQDRGLSGWTTISITGLAAMLCGLAVLLIALSVDPDTASRSWVYAPLALAVAGWFALDRISSRPAGIRHLVAFAAVLSGSTLLYPFAVGAFGWAFR